MGFRYVASGPMVRSSYKAGEYFLKGMIDKHNDNEKDSSTNEKKNEKNDENDSSISSNNKFEKMTI